MRTRGIGTKNSNTSHTEGRSEQEERNIMMVEAEATTDNRDKRNGVMRRRKGPRHTRMKG
jgi:hypothetical protein